MTTGSKTADFLARAIKFSGTSQKEIAQAAGFSKPNVLSMMKLGQTKVPINRIPALAEACHVDPVYFLKLAFREYHPEAYEVFIRALGEPLTRIEMDMVQSYRIAVDEDEELEIIPELTLAVLDTVMRYKRARAGGGPGA